MLNGIFCSNRSSILTIRYTAILLGLIAVLSLYLAYSKSDKITVNENAEVTGIISKLKEHAQGKVFWKRQLVLVIREIKRNESIPSIMAKLNEAMAKLNETSNKLLDKNQERLQKLYDEYPSSKPSEAQKQADALRELADALRKQADDIEHREMYAFLEKRRLERIERLKAVKAAIEHVIDGNGT